MTALKNTTAPSNSNALHAAFFAQDFAANTALRVRGTEYTYATLCAAAKNYAGYLASQGVTKGDRVGIKLDKSFDLYAALLGTLYLGAAYVPLAPSYPTERLNLIINAAQPKIVIDAPLTGDYPAPAPATIHGDDIAYILFTSGSTGVPKGVMVSHANTTAFINWAVDYLGIKPADRMSGHSDLNFDLSVLDTFGAFSTGACLVPVIDMLDKTAPSKFIDENKITIWFSVPSVLSSMAALSDMHADKLKSLRWAIFCGEALLPGPVRALMNVIPHARVANLYGPTEATVSCSAYELTQIPGPDATSIPIGWKTAGTEVFVWHANNRVAANGEQGEILIAGDQVALGYWNNPEETAKRFITDPRGTGLKCYKTGDIGLVLPEGPVFKGRIDNQIKFRGHRIELGDIEQALAKQDAIVECAVALITRDGKPDALAAFVRLSAPRKSNDIIADLRKSLPDYMIPTHVRILDDFPRTLNDKIDRKVLSNHL